MTAIRVVTEHSELENSGQVTHAELDAFIAAGGAGLPVPTAIGQVLMSITTAAFTPATPLTSIEDGWLINNDGQLLVGG